MTNNHRSESVTRLDQAKFPAHFGCDTFSWRTMQERLPKETFRACVSPSAKASA